MGVRVTQSFEKFLKKVRDPRALAKMIARLEAFEENGRTSDIKGLRGGIKEVRISDGKAYRMYFCDVGPDTVFLFGGDKSNDRKQNIQIEAAVKLFQALKKDPDRIPSDTSSLSQVIKGM